MYGKVGSEAIVRNIHQGAGSTPRCPTFNGLFMNKGEESLLKASNTREATIWWGKNLHIVRGDIGLLDMIVSIGGSGVDKHPMYECLLKVA